MPPFLHWLIEIPSWCARVIQQNISFYMFFLKWQFFFSFYKMLFGNRKKSTDTKSFTQFLVYLKCCATMMWISQYLFLLLLFFPLFDGKLETSVSIFSVFIVKLLKKSDTYNFYFILCWHINFFFFLLNINSVLVNYKMENLFQKKKKYKMEKWKILK